MANQIQDPVIVAAELIEHDKSVLLHAPHLFQQVQRRKINAAEFLDFLKDGLIKGLTPEEWLTELMETSQIASARGLLRLLQTPDQTITQSNLNQRSQSEQHACDKEIEKVRERMRRLRAELAHEVVEDFEYMLEEARQLIAEEWFSLAHENIAEIQRLLDRELADAMEKRRERFDKAQSMIKPMLEKFIHEESTLRLHSTIHVFWELMAYVNRLSVDPEGSLDLVEETCTVLEQLYQGAPPNEKLINRLQTLYGSSSEMVPSKLSAPPKARDDNVSLTGPTRYPLLEEEKAFLRKILDEPSDFLLWELVQAKIPTNVTWNEQTAARCKYEAQQIIRTLKAEPEAQIRLREAFRYLLRYWSIHRKTMPDSVRTYSELKEILWGYAEIKAIGLLGSGHHDAACEFYQIAFRLRAEAKNFFKVKVHLFHYFSACSLQQAYPNMSELQANDRSAQLDFDESLLIKEALSVHLEIGKDKTSLLVSQGLLKLAAMHPWLLNTCQAALDQIAQDSQQAQLLSAAFERLAQLLESNNRSTHLRSQFEGLTNHYIDYQQQVAKLLQKLWDCTASTRTLSGIKRMLDAARATRYLWGATDLALLDEFIKLDSELMRYFMADLSFSERTEIASTLQERIMPNLIHHIEVSPTRLGTIYLALAIENIQSILTQEQAALIEVSLPMLTVNVEQSEWRADGFYYCHLNIQNLGETYAENAQIYVDESFPFTEYKIVDDAKMVGTIYPDKSRSVHIRIKPTPLEENQSAFALLTRLQYTVPGRSSREERSFRLRVDDFSIERPQFQPIRNPYVVGGPLHDSELFRGRDQFIKELLAEVADPKRTGSVVIFGQKRSGKTSIIFHLSQRAPEFVVPVDFDIPNVLASLPSVDVSLPVEQRNSQREEVLARFLLALANGVVKAYRRKSVDVLPMTWEQIIAKPGPDVQFREFLEQFRNRSDGLRLLLIFDEFTALIEKIDEEMIDATIMRLFKSLIERGYFSCIICGLTEMYSVVKRFANQLAVSKPYLVDYLSDEAAKGLISEPIQLLDGRSRFISDLIIQEIIDLTAGSPYYIQMFCHGLVDYINRMKFERVTAADIVEVTKSLIQGRGRIDPIHFDNLYAYKDDIRDNREAILEGLVIHLLAHETEATNKPYATVPTLYKHIKHFVSEDELDETLNYLEQKLTIKQPVDDLRSAQSLHQRSTSRRYCIRVDLFRRWLAANRPIDEDSLRSFERKLSSGTL